MKKLLWTVIFHALLSGAWAQNEVFVHSGWSNLDAWAFSDNVLEIRISPTVVTHLELNQPTEVIDPKVAPRTADPVHAEEDWSPKPFHTQVYSVSPSSDGLDVTAHGEHLHISAWNEEIRVSFPKSENLYGMRATPLYGENDPRIQPGKGLLRNDGAEVKAGGQGDGGAPLVYTTHWGLLVDAIDGTFKTTGNLLAFARQPDVHSFTAYLIIGSPEQTMAAVTDLTGHPPMPPKWALGFMNSQWGSDEKEIHSIIDEYRSKQIPIDSFIMDFDFKAWGEDNFGEWRWNSTSGPGNVEPDKFPDGSSGKFAKDLNAKGIHLVGIMKPRILTQNVDLKPTVAASEATEHDWWMPKKPYEDYFSHRLANDLDFSKPKLRKWYWKHSKPLFETGIEGWWNDEADFGFDSLGFFHMQESLYEGQRSISNKRVWSLNRNFYLGAQRFAFGTWSGDIRTGFPTMQAQPARMLATIDLDQPHWSMDTGGFGGHPSSENYARWMEFASVVPIMRVHGTHNQKRQPWVYGEVAEAAAKKAIELRYKLFPYLYSCERNAHATGVGIVRPLFWEFPDDEKSANVTDEWMVGDSLMAAPVLGQGESSKTVYLPPGKWFDYWTGQPYEGGQTITIPCDATAWSDIPLFARAGGIVATQPVEQYAGEKVFNEITLDIWPDSRQQGRFEVYDDDGETYGYEKGGYFSQTVSCRQVGGVLMFGFSKPEGRYRTPISQYRLRIHGVNRPVTFNGQKLAPATATDYVETVVPAGQALNLSLVTAAP